MLGLVVLQVDETIEADFRTFFASGDVRLLVSRVPSGANLTPESIAQMEVDLPQAVRLLPPDASFDVVGYACTSGSAGIGTDKVRDLVTSERSAQAVTNPLIAALAAFRSLGLKTIGVVSPYTEEVGQPITDALSDAGVKVAETLSFGEEVEANVARIDPVSIRQATCDLAARNRLDGVFLSCTNLRCLSVIEPLENELGVPILSSNQVLAWHMAQLAGIDVPGRVGRLMKR